MQINAAMAEDATGGGETPTQNGIEDLSKMENKTESYVDLSASVKSCENNKDESGVVLETTDECTVISVAAAVRKLDSFIGNESCEVNEETRSLGDLDSLPAGDELGLGAAGSDSGVEGCGRALSSGGGSRSCASSVVSCGSGCGSESSSVAGAPPRPRRRVSVAVTEPPKPRATPVGTSTPRPVTAPRGPNLATRERARSREKPTPPEKPRPLTPKPRIRPTTDLPNLVRESPALRAKPTKTSTARCRTPNSPGEEKKWPTSVSRISAVTDVCAARVAADKYGTLPRRRREPEGDSSAKHEGTPPFARRTTVTRSTSSRSVTKTRVRIYAEKTSQTVLIGSDVEAALAGVTPNIESRAEATRCHRGVQASSRDVELSKLGERVRRAEEAGAEERARRERAEAQLAAERAAHAELQRSSLKLLQLAGAGADAGTEGCLRALEDQLRTSAELATRQRAEIQRLTEQCNALHAEARNGRERALSAEARLAEAEREAAEMQDFLAEETGALGASLREAEAELARAQLDLERRRTECRQLVRLCEQRRQEALAAAARARPAGGAGAALDHVARRLRALTAAVARAYRLPPDLEPSVYHNDAYSRSDSGSALSAGEGEEARGGLLAAVARALRPAPDDRERQSDDDCSAELLDSETEPCLVTDPECAEEWWSGSEPSPVREDAGSGSERESLRTLSAAIALRQRSEAEDAERGALLDRVLLVDNRLGELLRALAAAAPLAATATATAPPAGDDDNDSLKLAAALKDKLDVTEKNLADVIVKKLAELDASKNLIEQYKQSIEILKSQAVDGEDALELVEEEVSACAEDARRARYEALDAALAALARGAAAGCPRLAAPRRALERLAFALAAAPAPAEC